MGDEEIIPLNDELVTTARIIDIGAISANYSLVSISVVLKMDSADDLLNKYENDKTIYDNLVGILTYYGDLELMNTEFREVSNTMLNILNGLKDGLALTDSDMSRLKTNLSYIYIGLVEFAREQIGLHKSITFSVVDGELEKALAKVSGYPYAGVARLNSLLFKNVNTLIYLSKLMHTLITKVNTKMAQLDVMIDMSSVSDAYTIGEITRFTDSLYFDIINPVNEFTDGKYIDVAINNPISIKELVSTATDIEILDTINDTRESIKSIYSTLRVDTILNIYNADLNKLEGATVYTDANLKETLFKIKCTIDLLTELICSTTDSINGSIEKLKLSIPVSNNEIDDIDSI